jgi:hypothetical protein
MCGPTKGREGSFLRGIASQPRNKPAFRALKAGKRIGERKKHHGDNVIGSAYSTATNRTAAVGTCGAHQARNKTFN